MPLYNRRPYRTLRRRLRSHGTPAEAALWTLLKARRLDGWRWRRQFSVGPYILDLYCPAARLAIELDGAVHDAPARRDYDADRTRHLAAVGIRVLRFENRTVFDAPSQVLDAIRAALSTSGSEPGE
ncbi:endonuclease domain-containing protein [Rubrivirga sp. IMCC45206]|uniref:endonuclease domain-containing protein n=1 Tax=Rubrivirga sp. IMCC45206 TaxID=3391614 RepID=UPI0039902348